MHYLYILYSSLLKKYYIGQSHDVNSRLEHHNSLSNSIWTKRGQPWTVVGIFVFPTSKDAIIAEKFIKKQKSSKTIQHIIKEGFRFGKSILPNLAHTFYPGVD